MSVSPSVATKPELFIALDGKSAQESAEIIAQVADIQQRCRDGLMLGVKFNDLTKKIGFDGVEEITRQYPDLTLFVDGKDHDTSPTNTNNIQRLIDSGLAKRTRFYTVHPESYAAEKKP